MYKDKPYIVAVTSKHEPFVIDEEFLQKLPNLRFFKLQNGYIGSHLNSHTYLHHIVKPYGGVSIDHINQIKMDNRLANLRYATQSEQNRNQSKRKRNILLPEGCGINPQKM
jgi:hypothetical protein